MEGNRTSSQWGTIALTALPAAVWGSTYAVTQAWLPPGRPLFAATVRALPVGLLMLVWLRRLPRGDWWWRSFVLGGLTIGVFYALLFVAAYRLPSGLGATLVATAPVMTMAIAWLVLGQRPARASVTAGVVGLLGVSLLMLRNGLDRPLDPVGVAAGLLAVAVSTSGFVLTKKWAPRENVVTVTAWQLVAGGLVLLPLAVVFEGAPPALDASAVLALVYLGLVGSGVAYVLWFRGITLLGPTSASLIGLVNPVVGVLLGVAFLGEQFGIVHLVGMVLVVGSVVAAQEPVRAAVGRQAFARRVFVSRFPEASARVRLRAWRTMRTPTTSSSSASVRAESTSRAPWPSAACGSSRSTGASWVVSAPIGAASRRR